MTSLLAQDRLGGEIVKTRVGEGWHYYNHVGGERLDFTSSQFPNPIAYDDLPSTRLEALSDTSDDQYRALKGAFENDRQQ